MNNYEVGSIIDFGGYSWRVLEVTSDKMLIITEEIIMQQSYNDFKGDVTWADCSLRRYLNDVFYHQFSEKDQSRIIQVLVKNNNNPWYQSEGGEDTWDFVFLLSVEEVVCKYFGDSRYILENRREKQRYWFGTKDPNNHRRIASYKAHIWWWWLRSPGSSNRGAGYIHGDGNVGIQGNGTYQYNSKFIHPVSKENYGGVRPALWLDISDTQSVTS